jgi:squalene-hopene/tetraprenyl-beta-curcumene cyclase
MLTRPLTIDDTVHRAVARGRATLLDLQHDDGRWEGIARSDPGVTAQFLLMTRYLDRSDPATDAPLLAYLDRSQRPGGGWAAYPDGPPSLDVTLLCYAALRFAGRSPGSAPMLRARSVILAAGGIEAVGFVARFPLVFCDQIPGFTLTYLSPKLLFLPRWLHPHLRDLGILLQDVLPLELLLKQRAAKAPPPGRDIQELRAGRPFSRVAMSPLGAAISRLGEVVDIVAPARSLDRNAARWFAEQQNGDGLWAGNAVFTMRGVMALHATEPGRYTQRIERAIEGMRRLQIADGGTRWQQLALTPVLDTAIAVTALLDAGLPSGETRLLRAMRWLTAAQGADGGWSFSLENAATPDTDTTLHALEALARAPTSVPGVTEAIASGIRWLLARQDTSGGWAMWPTRWRSGRTMVREVELARVMDVSTPDVTARTVRALTLLQSLRGPNAALRRAIHRALVYLRSVQRSDGSWPGRWAVNYTYGTAQGLTAMAVAGEHDGAPARARGFLQATQQADGGWGESPDSDAAEVFIPAPSTVTQTSLALLGLLAAPDPGDSAVARGTAFLLERERDGVWDDDTFRQTVLLGRMYYQNSLFATSLAVTALARTPC